MINVSNAFRNELYEGHRDYLEYVDITLANGRVLNLTNKHLWQGGITIEDAVSSDNSFDVGAAIINKCTVTINNIYEDFSEYDFTDARVVPHIGLELPDRSIERVRKGTFTVDDATYNGSIITLPCLDNMVKFDKKYSESKLIYPATLGQIVRDACSVCDVVLQTYNFPHSDFVVNERPEDEAITFHQVIAWAAQIAGCFCRCDVYGRLELKWYDQESLEISGLDGGTFLPWTAGDTVDGGSFAPWTTGNTVDGGTFGDRDNIHHIYSIYNMNISVDDVVITGVRVLEKTKQDDKDAIATYQSGTDGYVVGIENNALIQGGAGSQISGWLGEQLIGLRFRKGNMSHSSDPTIEAGDVGFLTDRKSRTYRIIISQTKFTTGGSQTTVSSAENPARNSAGRFSIETKNYVDYRKGIEKERTDREKALEDLKQRMDESPGLFTTEETLSDGGRIFYMHNKPSLEESDIVWKMTAEAWGVSTDGGKTYNAGMTVDGDTIVRILTAVGVNADWIKTGAFQIIKNGKTMVLMDIDTGQVILRPDVFELSSGQTIDSIADSAAKNAVNAQTQDDIFNRLTKNGTAKGIYMEGNQLYILFDYAKGGTLKLGNVNNTHGRLSILDSSGQEIGAWDNSGIHIKGRLYRSDGYYYSCETAFQNRASLSYYVDGSMFYEQMPMAATSGGSLDSFVMYTSARKLSFGFRNASGGSTSYSYYEIYNSQLGSNGERHWFSGDLRVLNNIQWGDNTFIGYGSQTLNGVTTQGTYVSGSLSVIGNFLCQGTKLRAVETDNFGTVSMNALESTEPYFSDIGSGTVGESGTITIFFDPVFAETIDENSEYQVFITRTSMLETEWVEKRAGYFIVHGEPGATFDWMATCRQRDYSATRMQNVVIEHTENDGEGVKLNA